MCPHALVLVFPQVASPRPATPDVFVVFLSACLDVYSCLSPLWDGPASLALLAPALETGGRCVSPERVLLLVIGVFSIELYRRMMMMVFMIMMIMTVLLITRAKVSSTVQLCVAHSGNGGELPTPRREFPVLDSPAQTSHDDDQEEEADDDDKSYSGDK
jgi:hypothetical protein